MVANDAYASPEVWSAFERDRYHSPRVVWGREVNLITLGLAHQLAGAVDAGLLWWRRPMLTCLAAGCAAVAAYGAWGLLDRALESRSGARETTALDALRDLAAITGTAAALWAVLSFMAVALGNWNH